MKKPISTRSRIVTGLFYLLKKYPYRKIRVKQICRVARVSRMTYYRHFHTKADVINYSFDVDFTIFIQRVASCHLPSFAQIATIFFELIKQRRTKMALLFKNHLADLLLRRVKHYLSSLIDQHVLQTREQSSTLLIAVVAGGLTEIIITWIEGGTKIPVDSLVIFVSKYMHFRA